MNVPTANVPTTPESLATKIDRLRTLLRDMGGCLVAFSGGVDSTYLLAEAVSVLGKNAVALTAVSGTLPQAEYDEAKALALELGARHLRVKTDELSIDGYRTNPSNRCYYCKTELYTVCEAKAAELGGLTVVDGCNLDDLGDYRPGRQAADERAVRSPLVEAGFTKAEVRAASAALGLRTAQKAAFACLGSRFPYGTEITASRLARIGACEQALRNEGFHQFRCRFHEPVVRVELAEAEMARLFTEPGLRTRLVAHMKAQGFLYVALDLQGYRQGSLNEALSHHNPPRHHTPPHRVPLSRLGSKTP